MARVRDFISISLVFGALALCGCASSGGDDAAQMTGDGESGGAALSASGEMARKMLPNTDNGLEVRKWVITPQQNGQLLAELAEASRNEPGATDRYARLERNGFRFVRVPADEVDELIADIGGAAADVSEWHGQATDWRPLEQRSVGRTPRALAIDGRVRRFDRGSICLMIRSWTVQMETGPVVHLEAVPRHLSPQAVHLRRLLTDEAQPDGVTFGSMGLDLLLEPGFAYVLLSESPQTSSAADSGVASPPRKAQIGPFSDDEPELAAPQTIGEFQLATERVPPMRIVFVFVPKIASTSAMTGAAARAKAADES